MASSTPPFGSRPGRPDLQRALVTGGTGFVGSHLVRALSRSGVEVHGLVRASTAPARRAVLQEHASLVTDDGTIATLARALEQIRPDVVFHLATYFVAEHTADDVAPLIAANLDVPFRLAEALAAVGPTRFVNTGTVWQRVANEPYRPKGIYAATKQAAEDLLRGYAETGRLSVCTLTLTDVYGPADPRPKLLPALLDAARSGQPLPMGSGRPYVDLVHVDDVVRAYTTVGDDPGLGGDAVGGTWMGFGVGSGSPVTVRELVDIVGAALGCVVPVVWDARSDRPREMYEPWSPGPSPTGWAPRISLTEGIRSLS